MSIPSRVLISSNVYNDNCQLFAYPVSIPSRVLISSNKKLQTALLQIPKVSIPSRVLISSNDLNKLHCKKVSELCQSLQGFSYHLTIDNCSNTISFDECQSLQGFSYHLTLSSLHLETKIKRKVSIPSRVLISSNINKY